MKKNAATAAISAGTVILFMKIDTRLLKSFRRVEGIFASQPAFGCADFSLFVYSRRVNTVFDA